MERDAGLPEGLPFPRPRSPDPDSAIPSPPPFNFVAPSLDALQIPGMAEFTSTDAPIIAATPPCASMMGMFVTMVSTNEPSFRLQGNSPLHTYKGRG